MAEFTDQDQELLDKLRKAFESEGKTRFALEPWEEHIRRDASVNAARAVLAAKVVEGISGSWAAQYNYGWGSIVTPTAFASGEPVGDIDPQGPPVAIRAKTHKLGKRGLPEVNFVPYNWRTNTFGNKGPSLVGHPISFEVVGPTLKSPFTDWTWDVTPGGGANGGDLLTLGVRPDGAPSSVFTTVLGTYGPRMTEIPGTPWTIGDDAEPNGGLYLIVTDDGVNAGALDTGGGQVPMGALSNFVDSAPYEIFRISEITDFTIEIHPNKSFAGFFTLPGPRSIRAITIVRPYVTRLAAIPQSGAAGGNDGVSTSGREQTFVVMSPERAAGNDNYPPFDSPVGPGSGDGTWVGGGFTSARQANAGVVAGDPTTYGGNVRLPIPIPVREAIGDVENSFGSASLVGNWNVESSPLTPFTSPPFSVASLPIAHIYSTSRDDSIPGLTWGTIPSVLGWYDIRAVVANGFTGITMARVPETDPQTGLTYWGPGPFVSNIAGQTVGVGMTLHEPIDALWEGPFRIDKTEAARLKTLIDPNWVQRFEKQIADPLLIGGEIPPPGGSGPGSPDKAIFDTRTFFGAGLPEAANPGNFMDLGFRMVLFPAKEDPNDATQTIPDFNNPITGRELVIDASINEKQWVDVDYSSGIVRLSHPPPTSRSQTPNEETDVIPNGISGTSGNNTRAEVVLFAACVPYSMEDSQLGTGNRVTANVGDGHQDYDAYSDEVFAKIMFDTTVAGATTFTASPPFIGVAPVTGTVAIILDRVWDGPETGVISISAGDDNSAAFGRWGYTTKTLTAVGGFSVTALEGISSVPTVSNPDPSLVPGDATRGVILRREVIFGAQSLDVPAFTDFYPGDTTFGSESRAETLRFERARILPQEDGSLVVRPGANLASQLDRITGHLQPSRMTFPIDTTLNPPPYADTYLAEDGIYQGLSYQANATHPVTTNPGATYQTSLTPLGRGPAMRFGPAGSPPSWIGFITQTGAGLPGFGLFDATSNFRWVAKASVFFREPTPTATCYIGLILDGGPGVDPVVEFLSDPALIIPEHQYIGFQFDTRVGTTWRYWTRGSSLTNSFITTNAVANPALPGIQGPFYFVIESARTLGLLDSVTYKMGVYDADKNLVSSQTYTVSDTVPSPTGRGFYSTLALRENVDTGDAPEVALWFMKVILDTEIDDLPPLP